MRNRTFAPILALALLLTAAIAWADAPEKAAAADKAAPAGAAAEAAPAAAPAAQTAVFAVPDLGDAALVKKLNAALAKHDGVVAAKPEAEAGRFLVTFDAGKTTAEALAQVVAQAAPQAKLEGVQAADPKSAAHGDCGKCPSRATCQQGKSK